LLLKDILANSIGITHHLRLKSETLRVDYVKYVLAFWHDDGYRFQFEAGKKNSGTGLSNQIHL
jgi:hypothetical protein